MPDDTAGAARPARASGAGASGTGAAVPAQGVVLIVLITLVWGVSWPAMKIAVGVLHPWTFRTLTTVVAGVVMLALLVVTGTSVRVPRRNWLALALCSVVNVTSWMLCSAFALELLPAGRSVIVAYTMPAWATLFGALFLKERLTRSRLLGLALGLAGLAVLMGEDLGDLAAAPIGALFMLAGAVSWALGTILLKAVPWGIGVATLSAWQLFLGGVPIAIGAALVDEGGIGPFGWYEGLAFAYVFFAGVLFGNWTWLKLVSLMPASVAGIGTIAIPVFGVGSSMIVLGEAIGWREIVALVLVVASLVAVLVPRALSGAPRPIGRRLPPR
ncbi:MAG: DMT family transporter [Alphaproteobacteria bacterium]